MTFGSPQFKLLQEAQLKKKNKRKKNQKSDPWTKHTTIDNVNLCSLALSLGTTSNSDPKIPIRHNKFMRKEINQ